MVGIFDYPNYSTLDMGTITPSSFAEPSAPVYSAGPAIDTISLINPMPSPGGNTIVEGPGPKIGRAHV